MNENDTNMDLTIETEDLAARNEAIAEELRQKEARLYELKRAEEKKKNKILILILIIVLLLICACYIIYYQYKDRQRMKASMNNPTVVIDNSIADIPLDDKLTDSTNPLADRQVYFAGYDDFTVGPDNCIYLENLPENEDIFIAYEIYIGDELIHKTGLIPSGQYSEWIPADTMKPGEYDISIKNVPYYSYNGEDYSTLSFQPSNTVHMTIVDN